ncbi:MAG TPA: MFS transporter [Armatimonadota bacterium]|nr:MFS transporter [Armatimonadota bacterium]
MSSRQTSEWLNRDGLLLSLSAFFADLGYQGVTALYPLFLVVELRHSPLTYGLITGLSFGLGSLFALLGGRLGDRLPKKPIIIAGNLGILALAFSGLPHVIWESGLLFMVGWWCRYLRTPPRRALLVQVTPHEYRSRVFGFLHALDIGGGLVSILAAIALILDHVPPGRVIAYAGIPILISTLVLLPVTGKALYPVEQSSSETPTDEQALTAEQAQRRAQGLFITILAAAALYGFSFYNLGYPVLSAAMASKADVAGLAAYAIYLGVSAVSGWILGLANIKGLSALWKWGFAPSAVASIGIALSAALHAGVWGLYPAVALLGFGMGAVETYEPTLAASLRTSGNVSAGMGWLSASRSVGQFGSNAIMGLLFVIAEPYAYLFAGGAALLAAAVLAVAQIRYRPSEAAQAR